MYKIIFARCLRCAGRGRKTWRECVKDDTDELGLHPEWAVFRDMWRGLTSGKTCLTRLSVEEMDVLKINDDDDVCLEFKV